MNEIQAEKEYWQSHLSSRLSDSAFETIRDTVDACMDTGHARGLELGCGEAHLLRLMPNVIGIDYSIVGLCNARAAPGRLIAADSTRLPFPDGHFDFLVTNSLHHMPYRQTIREIYRTLKPGGQFFCFEPSRWHIFNLLFNRNYGREIVGDRGFFPRGLERELQAAGFEQTCSRFVKLNMDSQRFLTRLQRNAQKIPLRFFQDWFFLRTGKPAFRNA